eukprot:TRINITY_DN15891_c0_g2_i1.p1 TRINITY_DN15891_c0_g2~~TRINITY_DN15891_c0_g2_i1.p1  ORF type:complete len:675 (+),score=145.97 TRINITY_DN15891_c0_g2_i1:61-2025(+)
MSHNPYRIPLTLRKQAKQELQNIPPSAAMSKSKKKKRRRFPGKGRRYRPRFLINSKEWQKRSAKNRWMETHLWHAKRMKIVNRWSYRIALHPNDRNERFVYKSTCHFATIQDVSFMSQFVLKTSSAKGGTKLLIRVLRPFLAPFEAAISQKPVQRGQVCCRVNLYFPGKYPFGFICPAQIVFKPKVSDSPGRCVLVVVHPSIADVVRALLSERIAEEGTSVALEDWTNSLAHFHLKGSLAQDILVSAFHSLAKSGRSAGRMIPEQNQPVWDHFNKFSSADNFPRNCVFNLKIENAFNKVTPHASQKITQCSREQFTRAFVDTMSLFQRLPTFSTLSEASSSIWHRLQNFEEQQQKQQEEDICEVMLVQFPGISHGKSGFGSGWEVFVSSSWARVVFQSLVHAGARAIGLREQARFAFEAGTVNFPEDFPDSPAGKQFRMHEALEYKNFWDKRPPSKKVNYQLLGIDQPLPCLISWCSLFESPEMLENEAFTENDEVHAKLCRIGSANLALFNDIPYFVLRDPHVKNYLLGLSQEGPSDQYLEKSLIRVRVVHQNEPDGGKKGRISEKAMICVKKAINGEVIWPVIGYVTRAGFSSLRGYAVGFGFVRGSKLLSLMVKQDASVVEVYIRNISSNPPNGDVDELYLPAAMNLCSYS